FKNLSIKSSVADRFRKFCKKLSRSQSMTLLGMMEFFEVNELSPDDRLGNTLSGLKSQMKRRFNALIAIVRNIEKQQTLPTKAMLDTLFQEMSQAEDEDIEEEDFDFGTPEAFTRDKELEHYRTRYEEMQQQLSRYKNQGQELLEQMTYVKGTFGKGHYKLDMDKKEFENLKKEMQNVYHHHRTES